MSKTSTLARPATYHIKVQGRLDAPWAAWFEGMTVTPTDGETIISGLVADQAALHGLLAKIRDLGLPLLSVARDEIEEQAKRAPAEKHSQEVPK